MEANDPVKSESTKTIKLHIKRQDSPEAKSRYEDFEIEWHPNMNVVSALMAIRAHPVLADGTPTTPWCGRACASKKYAELARC